MADLGNLWFSLGLDDSKIEKQWKEALDKYGKDIKTKIDVEISPKTIESLKKLKDLGGTTKQWQAARWAAKAAKEVAAMNVQQEKYNTQVARTAVQQERLNTQLARTANIQNSVAAAQQRTAASQGNIAKNYQVQSLWLTNLTTLASNYLSLFAAKEFISNLARISGEFELQRKTLQAMIGEFEGSTLYSQIKDLAVVSPFQFKDLAGYTKQLAAFSVPYNELYETTKSLADISAGLGVDMSRIILAYGQIRSAGVLKGCLGKDTFIKTTHGVKAVQDITVGDILFNERGELVNVLELIRGKEQMYLIKQSVGDNYRVNENHILTLWDNCTTEIVDVYVKDYLKEPERYLGYKVTAQKECSTYSISIEKDIEDDYYGFVLDGNKRFQLADGTITHNTELRQLTEAGVPILEKLSQKFTQLEGQAVSVGDVFGKISQKLVPFEMVKDIFAEMTSEGGKFYNMQEIQAETLAGRISNLTDAYQIMLSELGESNEGALKGGIDWLYKLIDNYELLGSVIKTAGFAVGMYQLAQISAFTIEKIDKIRKSAVAMNLLRLNIKAAAAEMKALNIATKGTVFGIILSVVVALGVAIHEVIKSSKRFNKEMDKMLNADLSKLRDERYELEELKKATDGAAEGSIARNDAITKINSRYGEYLSNMLNEASTADEIATAYDRITEAMENKHKQEALEKAKNLVKEEYENAINKTISKVNADLISEGLTPKEAEDVIALLVAAYKKGVSRVDDINDIISKRIGEDLLKKTNIRVTGYFTDLKVTLREQINEYQKALEDAENKVNMFFGSATYSTKEEADLVERVNKAYDEAVANIKKNIPAEKAKQALQDEEIKKLKALRDGYEKLGITNMANKYQSQLNAMIKAPSEWEQKIKDIIKSNTSLFEFNPKDGEQLSEYLKRIQERYNELIDTRDILNQKITDGEDITGAQKELSIINEKIKGEERLAAAINFRLERDGDASNRSKEQQQLQNQERAIQNYQNKLSDFTSNVILKTDELRTSLSSISLDNINADDVASKLAKINSEFDKGIVDIEKYEEQLIKAWRGVLEAKAKSEGDVFKGDVTLDMLPDNAKIAIEYYNQLIEKKREYDEALLNKSVIDKYATLEKQRQDILSNAFAEFELAYDSGNFDDFDTALWSKTLKENLEGVSRELDPIYKKIFGNLQAMTREQILEAIQLAKNLLKQGGLSDEFTIELRDRISKLQEAYDKINERPNATLDLNTLLTQVDKYKELKELADKLKDAESERLAANAKEQLLISGIATTAHYFAEGLSFAAENMKEIADLTGDIQLGDAADKMNAFAQNLNAAAQGASQGGWIGAIVGGVMDMVTQTAEGIANTKKQTVLLAQSLEDYEHKLRIIQNTIKEEDYDLIFGSNSLLKVNDAAQKAKDALDDYNEYLNKKIEYPGKTTSSRNWGVGVFLNPFQLAVGEISSHWYQQLDAYKRGLTELQGMAINLTKYTGWQKFWGKQDKYQSLIDYRPDVFNDDGTLNIENAKALLEVDKQITDAQKEQIEKAIELQELYEENMKIVTDYLSDIFSNTASTISTQMIDAFARTGDAAFEMGDIVNDVAKSMASDLVESLLLDQYLTPAMNRIKDMYDATSADFESDSAVRTQKAIQAMREGIAAAQDAVPEVNKLLEALEATGIDLASDSESASQVLSGLTEDQQNLLVSYINGIRADVSINKGIITTIANYTGAINNNIATALIVWKQIEANTHRSADGVDRLVGYFENVIGAYDGGGGQAIRVNIA